MAAIAKGKRISLEPHPLSPKKPINEVEVEAGLHQYEMLLPHLRPFLIKITEDSISPWTDKDLAVIAATLTRSPQKWKISDAQPRIHILRKKPFPPSKYASDLQKRVDEFKEILRCDPSTVLRTVMADDLLPTTKKMNNIPIWTVKNTKFALPSLTGLAFVLSDGCSAEGLTEFQKFQGRWFSFLDVHPVIMGQVDPWYVVMLTPPPPDGYPAPRHNFGHNIDLPMNHPTQTVKWSLLCRKSLLDIIKAN